MDLSKLEYHKASEEIIKVLCDKAQNDDPTFFRGLLPYYLGVLASNMHVKVIGWERAEIPVNIYSINLAPSGTGKGHSSGLIENQLMKGFRDVFEGTIMPMTAEENMRRIAVRRSNSTGEDWETVELPALEKEFRVLGSYPMFFDSGSSPAIKQLRNKILIANCGSVNLQIDEIGANLLGQTEALNSFLELYDMGRIKDKLIKSNSDNVRSERIDGSTPANMLLFGTQSKLFDGGATEKNFFDFLEMGYARRGIFSVTSRAFTDGEQDIDAIIAKMFNADNDTLMDSVTERITKLADMSQLHRQIQLPLEALRMLVQYRLYCRKRADSFNNNEAILRMDMEHRYWKAIKLAGAYAFFDMTAEITTEQVGNAIRLIEDSGEYLKAMCTPDYPHMRLARYLAESGEEKSQSDIMIDCLWFKGSKQQKAETIDLAIAWGSTNNIVIKRNFVSGIEFLKGETLKATNLKELIFSFTNNPDMTSGYKNVLGNWENMADLTSRSDLHWLNHHTTAAGYRNEENMLAGFNMLVLDIDGTYPIPAFRNIMSDFKYFLYTTKSHKPDAHRYRVIIPINYELKLSSQEYKELIHNVFESLPFEIDEAGDHRCKKWTSFVSASNGGGCMFNPNEGAVLFDILPFIPKTKKNEERKEANKQWANTTALEAWFLQNTGNGNRNHQLHKYARVLMDRGFKANEVRDGLLDMNSKLPDPMPEAEIDNTIMKTVNSKI